MDYGRLILLIGLLAYYSVKYIKEKKNKKLSNRFNLCPVAYFSFIYN